MLELLNAPWKKVFFHTRFFHALLETYSWNPGHSRRYTCSSAFAIIKTRDRCWEWYSQSHRLSIVAPQWIPASWIRLSLCDTQSFLWCASSGLSCAAIHLNRTSSTFHFFEIHTQAPSSFKQSCTKRLVDKCLMLFIVAAHFHCGCTGI